jgi:hypothetical protein
VELLPEQVAMPAEEKRSDPDLAELAALADGSLPPDRRALVEQRVAESPRLQALLQEQREALAAVRALDERAPGQLRSSISSSREKARRRRVRRGVALGATAVAGLAAVALIALPASEPESPTLAEAAALAARTPTAPAGERVEAWGIEYPDLAAADGWRMTGARNDRLGEQTARTVFYAKDGRRIAYTILSSGDVRAEGATRSWRRKGNLWYAFEQNGRTVVAWERKGHMCVVSANGLGGPQLVELITS